MVGFRCNNFLKWPFIYWSIFTSLRSHERPLERKHRGGTLSYCDFKAFSFFLTTCFSKFSNIDRVFETSIRP